MNKKYVAAVSCVDKNDPLNGQTFLKFTDAINLSQAELIFNHLDYADEYPDYESFEVEVINEVPVDVDQTIDEKLESMSLDDLMGTPKQVETKYYKGFQG